MPLYQIVLPYYKQGDDLGYAINHEGGDIGKGLLMHAEMLKEGAKQLEDIFEVVSKFGFDKVVVDADAHLISIDGPKDMMEELAKLELVCVDEDSDEDLWEEMCCGDWGEDECEYCSECCCDKNKEVGDNNGN
jgi:hypothetical protein